MFYFFKKIQMIQAVENGDVAAVRHFLKKGIDPNDTVGEFERKRNLMSIALMNRHLNVAEVLYQSGAKIEGDYGWNAGTLLHLVAEIGYVDGAKFLLKKQPDILDQKNGRGATALHLAAKRGNTDCVKILLAQDADTTIKDPDNRTAKYWAEVMRRADIVYLFELHEQKKMMAQEPVVSWRKLDDMRVACITQEKRAGYKITDIFNFKARERTKICQNVTTKHESSQTMGFDDMRDKTLLRQAFDELKSRGGQVKEEHITGVLKASALSRKPEQKNNNKKDLK